MTVINALATTPFNLASPLATVSYTVLPMGYAQEGTPTTEVGSSTTFTAQVYLNAGQLFSGVVVGTAAAPGPPGGVHGRCSGVHAGHLRTNLQCNGDLQARLSRAASGAIVGPHHDGDFGWHLRFDQHHR